MLQCWDDAARLADRKWEHIFGEVVPKAQAHLARLLGTTAPGQIAFAANTHDFVVRLLSCFEEGRPLRVLTTDSEFHSFARQAARLEEGPRVRVTRVAVEPFADLRRPLRRGRGARRLRPRLPEPRLLQLGLRGRRPGEPRGRRPQPATPWWWSTATTRWAPSPSLLAPLEDRVFYLGGGYKYLQAGEGSRLPPRARAGARLRPVVTGWFSQFGALTAKPSGRVDYPDDAFRFWGATWDPTPAYRFNAVMDLWQREGVTPERCTPTRRASSAASSRAWRATGREPSMRRLSSRRATSPGRATS